MTPRPFWLFCWVLTANLQPLHIQLVGVVPPMIDRLRLVNQNAATSHRRPCFILYIILLHVVQDFKGEIQTPNTSWAARRCTKPTGEGLFLHKGPFNPTVSATSGSAPCWSRPCLHTDLNVYVLSHMLVCDGQNLLYKLHYVKASHWLVPALVYFVFTGVSVLSNTPVLIQTTKCELLTLSQLCHFVPRLFVTHMTYVISGHKHCSPRHATVHHLLQSSETDWTALHCRCIKPVSIKLHSLYAGTLY